MGARRSWFVPLTAAAVLMALPAGAQTAPGPMVRGTVGVAVANSGTNLAFSGAAGYRMNRVFGFELELAYIPSLGGLPDGLILPAFQPDFDQSVLAATNNIRLEVPTITSRVTPFVVAGAGIASTQTQYSIDPIYTTFSADLTALGVLTPSVIPARSYTATTTGLAMTIGGGVGIAVTPRLSIDVDLRELHVHGTGGGDIGRFGVGASYRF